MMLRRGVVVSRVHGPLRQTRRLHRRQPTIGWSDAGISHGCVALFRCKSVGVWIGARSVWVHAEQGRKQLESATISTSEPDKERPPDGSMQAPELAAADKGRSRR